MYRQFHTVNALPHAVAAAWLQVRLLPAWLPSDIPARACALANYLCSLNQQTLVLDYAAFLGASWPCSSRLVTVRRNTSRIHGWTGRIHLAEAGPRVDDWVGEEPTQRLSATVSRSVLSASFCRRHGYCEAAFLVIPDGGFQIVDVVKVRESE